MTRIVDPDPSSPSSTALGTQISPDRRNFFAITSRPSLERGLVRYQLIVLEVARARARLKEPRDAGSPAFRVVAESWILPEEPIPHPGIESPKWIRGGRSLSYLRRDANLRANVRAFDLDSSRDTLLSPDDVSVLAYDIAQDGRTLVYSMQVEPDWEARRLNGYPVTFESMNDILARSPTEIVGRSARYYIRDVASRQVREIHIPPSLDPMRANIAISPDGQWAVIFVPTPHDKIPRDWMTYSFLSERRLASPAAVPDTRHGAATGDGFLPPDVFSRPPLRSFGQFWLIDIETGTARPLLNAPSRLDRNQPAGVWAPDSAAILLPRTYLPLTTRSARESGEYHDQLAAAIVDVRSRGVQPLTRASGASVVFRWLTDDTVAMEELDPSAGNASAEVFRNVDGRWIPVADVRPASSKFSIYVDQNSNTPPNIGLADHESHRQGAITDFNPQLRALSLGHVRPFAWKDRAGREFQGGLLYPRDFHGGSRFPVVLQTYGFSPNEFLVDGPQGFTSAFSARALASRGMLVLQMPESGGLYKQNDSENGRFTMMVEGAIDALDAAGLVERGRVGLVGFSRTGMNVLHAVTFSSYPIAAAVICDSTAASPFTYASAYGSAFPGMLEWEADSYIGAPLWGEGIRLWQERAPLFNLDRVRTPLRFETLGAQVPSQWETFAILKRHQRPVEMIHVPSASHVIQQPRARYTSQQGTVDWFAYWLLGSEDADVSKIEQYRRWRVLRSQYDAIRGEAKPARVKATVETRPN